MSSILKDLYEGNINPYAEMKIALDEYALELREMTKTEENFIKKLDEDMQNEFYKIIERWISLYPLELRDAYIKGYKLGVKMMAEVYK
ncbi:MULTISPECIES: DUF6809 family protein [Anaerofustis]|uniref:DUF6809 family protein n=1 Tax=Anaerofustis TaxID=264995 RepID=UPI001107571C|nr:MULTISPECIES: DUF6809 family protein [Anaerofustis]MCO8194608.1 hypothetical protein [Anaerofustis sp. NSJ-163]